MGVVGISDVTYALHKIIMPYIRDNFPSATILLDQIKKNGDVTVMNNYFYAGVRTSRHAGIVALASDKGKLVSGGSTGAQAYVPVKSLTGTFDISKLVLDVSKNVKGAVVNQLTEQSESLTSDFAKDLNRQLHGDGTGEIARADGAGSSSTSLTVQNPFQDAVNGDIKPTKYLAVGMQIKIGSNSAVGITAINTSTNVVTIDSAQTWSDEDSIVKADGDGNAVAEIMGLRGAIDDDTTYAGLTRASTPQWTGVLDEDVEALTISDLEDVYLEAREFGRLKDRYAIFMNKTPYKTYGNLLTDMKRVAQEKELLGGWTGLEFSAGAGKVGVFLDYDTPDGDVGIYNLDSMIRCEVGDVDWVDDPKSGLVRRSDYLTYQAVMAYFANLLVVAPGANGRMSGKS